MNDIQTYYRNKTNALKNIKKEYNKLKDKLITYEDFKFKVYSIMKKYGCKYKINDALYYVDIKDRRYYLKSFFAGDFDLQFVVDINLVDFNSEKVSCLEDVPKGGTLHECFVSCIDDGTIENFNNEY